MVGTEYFLEVGDSVEVDGKTITLKEVFGNKSATIEIKGDSEE